MAEPQSSPSAPLAPQLFAPGAVYLTGEESLRLSTWNIRAALTVTVRGRIFTPEGRIVPFEFKQVPNTDRTVKTTDAPLGRGWLMHAIAFATSAVPFIGETWAQLSIVRGDTGATHELEILSGGYLTQVQPVSYPGGRYGSSIDGAGVIRTISGTDPAAGAEISETVPTGARWRLMSLQSVLTTSVAVANRNVQIVIDDGTNETYRAACASNQAASNAFRYSFSASGVTNVPASANTHMVPTPAPAILGPGYRIRTITNLLDAGDNWSQAFILVEEWQEVRQ